MRLVCPIRRGVSAPGRVGELGAWMTGVRGYAVGNEIENIYHDAASFTGDLGEADNGTRVGAALRCGCSVAINNNKGHPRFDRVRDKIPVSALPYLWLCKRSPILTISPQLIHQFIY